MNNTSDNKYIFRKVLVNIALIGVGAFLVALILQNIQKVSIREKVTAESRQILNRVSDTISKNREDVEKLTEIYHTLNHSTAHDIKEVLDNDAFDYLWNSDEIHRAELLEDIVNCSDVPYLFVMDEKGQVLASPVQDFMNKNLVEEQLLTKDNLARLITNDGQYAKEENDTGSYYFYADKIATDKGNYYAVLGTNAEILETQFATLNDVTRVIENIVVGDSGFIFAIDKEKEEFLYYEDERGSLTGGNIYGYGLTSEVLNDNYSGKESINGKDYYCVSKDCGQYTIAVAASDLNQMYSTGTYSWKWSIAGFVTIAVLCLIYASIVRNDFFFNERKAEKKTLFTMKGKEYFFNETIFIRVFPVIVLGIILIFGISFYSTTMLDISKAISDSNVNINELENNFQSADVTKEIVESYYDNQYLAKARILAYLFEENPKALNEGRNKTYFVYEENVRVPELDDEGNSLIAVANSKILEHYCKENGINAIYIFDTQGRTIATNLDDWYFKLSMNPADQSYPFRDVLDQKKDYYIQTMGEDEVGRKSQYIGTTFSYYTTKDSNGDTQYVSRYDYYNYQQGSWKGNPIEKHDSLLQISLNTEVMENILASTEYRYLVDKSAVNNGYLILFDSSDDHMILYSPKEESIGKKASEVGLKPNSFSGNYIGFQRANGVEYLIDIQYYQGYYIGTAILKDHLFVERTRIAVITATFGFLFIIIMSGLITVSSEEEEKIYLIHAEKVNHLSDRIMFMIATPSGVKSATEKAVSRWDNKNIPWSERTPEQKLAFMFFVTMALSIINLLLFTFMVGKGRVNDTVLSFIISGNWDKGTNIFAFTACALVMTSAIVAAQLLNIPIRLVTSIFGTKSETIGHLLASVVKYAVTIYSIFYCLYLLGFNSASLLTSAGILSLIVGLGSQSLIKDVVAGIFIIFEGSFRVGDIVSINGYRGQVLDVGLRTTKIMAADHNIKIINNNDVNGVINMTRVSSLLTIDVPIAYGVSMIETEKIMSKELPSIQKKVKGIIDGPFYKGVSKFDHKIITVQVSVLCKESDIEDIKSGLYREVLDIIYRHNLHEGKK